MACTFIPRTSEVRPTSLEQPKTGKQIGISATNLRPLRRLQGMSKPFASGAPAAGGFFCTK
jgi:hypothetical protein